MVVLRPIYVHHQEYGAFRGSYGVPPLFALHDAILAEDHVRVVEDKRRTHERETTVFLPVDLLLKIPL
jgi:hypothetical protein